MADMRYDIILKYNVASLKHFGGATHKKSPFIYFVVSDSLPYRLYEEVDHKQKIISYPPLYRNSILRWILESFCGL